MSLAGILKYQRLPFWFFALTFAAEVDVKKVPTSAAHAMQSEERLAVLCWHTGGGGGDLLQSPFQNFGASFRACGFGNINHPVSTIDRLSGLHFFSFYGDVFVLTHVIWAILSRLDSSDQQRA